MKRCHKDVFESKKRSEDGPRSLAATSASDATVSAQVTAAGVSVSVQLEAPIASLKH